MSCVDGPWRETALSSYAIATHACMHRFIIMWPAKTELMMMMK